MSKKTKYILILILIIIVDIAAFYILIYKKNNLNEITKYEIKTNEYFSEDLDTGKYVISSAEELDKFYKLYSSILNINEEYLGNNSIFVQTEKVGSSSTQLKLSAVTFENNNVNFVVERKNSEIGTTDMAFWYLVAIIPNEKLTNLNLDGWKKPSEVSKKSNPDNTVFELDNNNKYKVITYTRWKTMRNDGGSNINIYYQIDLDNKLVSKIREDYHANLGGTATASTETMYTKKLSDELCKKIKKSLDEFIDKEDVNNDENFDSYNILTLNKNKEIYSLETIEDINKLLTELDNLV